MKNLSQILSELANHGSWEGYSLLLFAIKEAVRTQPASPSMDQLCKTLVGITGKRNPETIYRSMARAVDDIWARPESHPLLEKYYRRELVEKPTLDGFISALSRYLWEEPAEQSCADSHYQISFDFASRQYGIATEMAGSKIWATFPAISPDLERMKRIVAFLNQKQVTYDEFKDLYLAGGLGNPTEEKRTAET